MEIFYNPQNTALWFRFRFSVSKSDFTFTDDHKAFVCHHRMQGTNFLLFEWSFSHQIVAIRVSSSENISFKLFVSTKDKVEIFLQMKAGSECG